MKNDGKPWRAELLKDLSEACQAILAEGLKDLTPTTVDMVHTLLALGKAELQVISVMGATGAAGVICALTRRNAEPVVLFRIDMPAPDGPPEMSH